MAVSGVTKSTVVWFRSVMEIKVAYWFGLVGRKHLQMKKSHILTHTHTHTHTHTLYESIAVAAELITTARDRGVWAHQLKWEISDILRHGMAIKKETRWGGGGGLINTFYNAIEDFETIL